MRKRRGPVVTLGTVHSSYLDARGRAQGTSTTRLQRQLRRLPDHSADQQVAARRKALLDELRDRGGASR